MNHEDDDIHGGDNWNMYLTIIDLLRQRSVCQGHSESRTRKGEVPPDSNNQYKRGLIPCRFQLPWPPYQSFRYSESLPLEVARQARKTSADQALELLLGTGIARAKV